MKEDIVQLATNEIWDKFSTIIDDDPSNRVITKEDLYDVIAYLNPILNLES